MRKAAKLTGGKQKTSDLLRLGTVPAVPDQLAVSASPTPAPTAPAPTFGEQLAGLIPPAPKPPSASPAPIGSLQDALRANAEAAKKAPVKRMAKGGPQKVSGSKLDALYNPDNPQNQAMNQRGAPEKSYLTGLKHVRALMPEMGPQHDELAKSYIIARVGGYDTEHAPKMVGFTRVKPAEAAREFVALVQAGNVEAVAREINRFRKSRFAGSLNKAYEEERKNAPTVTEHATRIGGEWAENVGNVVEGALGGKAAQRVVADKNAHPAARFLARLWTVPTTTLGGLVSTPVHAAVGAGNMLNAGGDATFEERIGGAGNLALDTAGLVATGGGLQAAGGMIRGGQVLKGIARGIYETALPVQHPTQTPKMLQSVGEQVATALKTGELTTEVLTDLAKEAQKITKGSADMGRVKQYAQMVVKAANEAGAPISMKDAMSSGHIVVAMEKGMASKEGRAMIDALKMQGVNRGVKVAPEVTAPKPKRVAKPKAPMSPGKTVTPVTTVTEPASMGGVGVLHGQAPDKDLAPKVEVPKAEVDMERDAARKYFAEWWQKHYGQRDAKITVQTELDKRNAAKASEPVLPELTLDEARRVAKMSDEELAIYNGQLLNQAKPLKPKSPKAEENAKSASSKEQGASTPLGKKLFAAADKRGEAGIYDVLGSDPGEMRPDGTTLVSLLGAVNDRPRGEYAKPWYDRLLYKVQQGQLSAAEADILFKRYSGDGVRTPQLDHYTDYLHELEKGAKAKAIKNAFYENMRQWGMLDEEGYITKEGVQQALSEGKPVPPEVLKDYPELAPKVEPAPVQKAAEKAVSENEAQAKVGAKVQDFGEYIPGARKDMEIKPKKTAKAPTDDRPAWERRYEVSQVAKSRNPEEEGMFVVRDNKRLDWRKQPTQVGKLFKTEADAKAAIPLLEVSRTHGVTAEGDSFSIYRRVSDTKRPTVKSGFATRDDALRYMAEHPHDLINFKFPTGDGIEITHLDNVKREGWPTRRSGDADAKSFSDAFGFRGVQFGNWNMGERGQRSLNAAYDALHDLSELTGVSPKALSLNGELGLAFGARGHGLTGAAAHYEPGQKVINLTREHGVGALAHEWLHALDYHFGARAGQKTAFSEAKYMVRDSLRPETKEAFMQLKEAILTAEREIPASDVAASAKRYIETNANRVNEYLSQIERDLGQERKYYSSKKPRPPASDAQMAEFHRLAERIKSGNGSRVDIDAMADLYKKVKGYGMISKTHDAVGNRLWAAMRSSIRDAENVKNAAPMKVKGASQYLKDARLADSVRVSDYDSQPKEMWARAFQSWLYDKLKGKPSQYLNLGGHPDAGFDLYEGRAYRYPRGEERAKINAAFDNLFATLKERPTEKGVELYQKAPKAAKGQYEWNPEQRKGIITLFENADLSTVLHETAHHQMRYLEPSVVREVAKMAGVNEKKSLDQMNAREYQKVQELWARAWEDAIHGKTVGSPEMQAALNHASKKLREVYGEAGVPMPEGFGRGKTLAQKKGSKRFQAPPELTKLIADSIGGQVQERVPVVGKPQAKPAATDGTEPMPKDAEGPARPASAVGQTVGISNESMAKAPVTVPEGVGMKDADVKALIDKHAKGMTDIDAVSYGESVGRGEVPLSADSAAKAQAGMGVLTGRVNALEKELDGMAADHPHRAQTIEKLDAAHADLQSYVDTIHAAVNTEWHRIGRTMQAEVDPMGDFARMKESLRRSKGEDLTPQEMKNLKEVSRKYDEAQAEIAKLRAELDSAPNLPSGKRRTPAKVKEARVRLADLLREQGRVLNQLDDEAMSMSEAIRTLANEKVHEGARGVDDVVKAIQSEFPALSRQEIIDGIAYKGEPRTKSEIQKAIADLKSQASKASTERKARLAEIEKAKAARRAEVEARAEARRAESAEKKAAAAADREAKQAAKAAERNRRRLDKEAERLDAAADKERQRIFDRESEIRAQIADYQRRLKSGDYDTTPRADSKPERIKVLEAEAAYERKRFMAMKRIAEDKTPKVVKWATEAAGAFRFVKLGMDLGQVMRQGRYAVLHGKAYGKGLVNLAHAMRSEANYKAIMHDLDTRKVGGVRMAPIRSKAGLSMTDAVVQHEEGFASKYMRRLPIVGGVLDRSQTAFINTVRANMFDSFYSAGRMTEADLQARASFINDITGRSNMKSVSKAAEVAFTSPRYEVSRWATLLRPLKDIPMAVKGNKGAQANVKDMVGNVASVLGPLLIADALVKKEDPRNGVEWDFRSGDFLKFRHGNHTYDFTAGIAPRARTMLRTAWGLWHKDMGYVSKTATMQVAGSLNPGITTPVKLTTGQSMMGFKDDGDDAWWEEMIPLIAKGAVDNVQTNQGPALFAADFFAEAIGVGASTYKKGELQKPKGDKWVGPSRVHIGNRKSRTRKSRRRSMR